MLALGLVTSWLDRKVTARVQARIGPPWYQPAADILKLLGKETLAPEGPGRTVFLAAPIMGLAGMTLAAALLGEAIISPNKGFIGDIVVLVYLLIIPAIALILGASAVGNPFSSVGASREMKLILGYELPYLIVVATVIMKTGFDFRMGAIAASQAANGWNLWSVSGIIGFIVLLMSAQAKLGLVPFDIPEADQELMGGVITEYSGPPLAVIRITKTLLLAVMPLFMVVLLMGGIRMTAAGAVFGLVKYLIIVTLIVLVRNTNPRIRIDQALRFFWGPVTLLAVVGFILAIMGW
jgi:NADH-quinone oxidoreductase subunit H